MLRPARPPIRSATSRPRARHHPRWRSRALVTEFPRFLTAVDTWDKLELRIAPAPFLYQTEYHYDPSGNLARIERQSDITGDPQTTTFTYNVLDWQLTAKNELNETTTFGYDPNGNLTTTTAPDLNATTRIFDERNLPYQETAANGDQVRLHYHANGRLLRVVDGNGNPTQYDYDAFDRPNLITHADNSSESRSYDPASRITSSTTRSAATFTYGYDDLNRLRSRSTPEEVATFTYDLGGRMTTAANPAASLVFGYNARNQLTSEITTIAGLSARTVLHAYDGVGNRTQMTHPDAGYITYGYDELDRLELLQDGGTTTLSQWTWDELSRPATRVLPSGIASAWTYDEASRIATITHADSGGPIDARTYGRDPTGTITSLIDGLGTHLYGYDASKQLTSVDYGAASSFPDTMWTYDDTGSRLTETAGSSTTYVPNALNQYASVGGVTQVYDTNGNLIDDGTNTYTFDSQSRLVSALADDGAGGTIAASYGYDAFMRRVRKTVEGATTYFLWSGSELIEEYDGVGDRQVQYIYGAEYSPVHIRAEDASGVETLFDVHGDHLSTPRLVTDSGEGVVWRANYSGFGEASVDPSSSLVLNVRSPGQYFDGETRLHYNRHRHSDPKIGRYLSLDPIGQETGINLYSYVMNDPVNWFDPDGAERFRDKHARERREKEAKAKQRKQSRQPKAPEPTEVRGGHDKNTSPSTLEKHQKGESRRARDQARARERAGKGGKVVGGIGVILAIQALASAEDSEEVSSILQGLATPLPLALGIEAGLAYVDCWLDAAAPEPSCQVGPPPGVDDLAGEFLGTIGALRRRR